MPRFWNTHQFGNTRSPPEILLKQQHVDQADRIVVVEGTGNGGDLCLVDTRGPWASVRCEWGVTETRARAMLLLSCDMARTQRTSASAYFVWSTVAAITPPFSENSRYRGTPTVPQSSQDKGGLTNPPNPNSDSDSSSAPRARVVRRSVWRGRGGGLGGDCYRCGSCDVLLGAVGSEPPAAIATPPGRDRLALWWSELDTASGSAAPAAASRGRHPGT